MRSPPCCGWFHRRCPGGVTHPAPPRITVPDVAYRCKNRCTHVLLSPAGYPVPVARFHRCVRLRARLRPLRVGASPAEAILRWVGHPCGSRQAVQHRPRSGKIGALMSPKGGNFDCSSAGSRFAQSCSGPDPGRPDGAAHRFGCSVAQATGDEWHLPGGCGRGDPRVTCQDQPVGVGPGWFQGT